MTDPDFWKNAFFEPHIKKSISNEIFENYRFSVFSKSRFFRGLWGGLMGSKPSMCWWMFYQFLDLKRPLFKRTLFIYYFEKTELMVTFRYKIPMFLLVGPFFKEGGGGLEIFGQKLKF